MSNYIDGFVLTIARRNLAAYRRLARKAGKVWRDHGALAYVECAGDDMNAPGRRRCQRLRSTKGLADLGAVAMAATAVAKD